MTRKTWPKGVKNIYIFTSTVALIFILFGVRQAFAISTSSVNLQGKIVRNDTGHEGLNVTPGNPPCVITGAGNDTCDFRVRYYNAPSGGTLLLTEEFSNKEIGQYNGAFNLSLGTDSSPTAGTYSSLSALINGEDAVYIEIGFAPGGNNSYTEVFTRMPLQASPYAIRSKYASEASNVSWSGITNPEDNQSLTMGTHNTAWNWSTGLFSSNWDSNAGANNLFSLNTGNITGTGSLLNVQTGSSATISPLRVRAGSSEAIFVDNQGRVGLGTTSPLAKLHVLGGGIFEDLLATSPEGGLVEVGGVRYAGAVSIPAVSTTSMGAIESPWIRTGYYQNFLRYTEEFQRSTANDWVQTNIASVTANSHVAPLETATTADTIVGNSANGALTQTVAASAAGVAGTGPWTFSIYLKTNSGTADVDLQINSTNASGVVVEAGTAKTVTINETWQRYSVVQDFTNASHTRKNVVLKVGTNTVIAWGAQLEPSSYARRYSAARTTSLVTTNTSTALISTALGVSGSISGTSIAASSSITSTRSGTPAAPVEGLIATAGAATAAIPVRPSPRLRLRGTAWNTTPTAATNNIDFSLETMPISGPTTSGYLRFLYGGHGAALVGHTEVARLTNTGDFTVIGNIGIGTLSPTEKLDVDGAARIRTISNASGNILTVSSTGVVQQRTPAELLGDIGAGSGDGTVTSVDVSGGTTGLTTSGGPITSSGTITLSGTLNVASGGTGNTSFTSGKILFGNGTNAIATDTDLHWDNTNKRLGVGTATPVAKLDVAGDINVSSGQGFRINNTATSGQYLRGDGTRFVSSTIQSTDLPGSFSGFASPTATVGLTATNGSATTAMRSDAAPALSQAIVPTWTGLHTFTSGATIRGLTVDHATATRDKIAISVANLGSNSYIGTITNADLTAARTWTLPDATGTLALTSSLYGSWTIKDSSSDTGESVGSGQDVQILGGTNVTTSRSGRNITISATDTNTATAADDILKGSNIGTEIKYSPYTTNEAANVRFYTSSNNPTGTGRLNIGAHFHATRLYAGNGTSALPSLSFSADTNTGIFGTGSDVLGFSTAASERMRIAANGNVGIGTTAPTVKLDVAGQGRFESTVYPVVDITRDTGGSGGGIYGGARLQRKTTAPVNGGGIGFFFWYPNSAGVLEEAGMFGGALANTTSGSEIGEIVFGAAYHGVDPYTQRHLMIRAVNSSSGEVRIPYRLKIGADSSPSKELDITGDAIISGLLGVGTTAPTQKLHVEGGIRLGSTSNANNVLNTAAAGGNPSGSLYWGNKELAYSSSLYGGWTIKDSSSDAGESVGSGQDVQILGGTNVTTSRSGRNITISATDANTTYSEITESEIDSTTSSTGRLITGRRAQYLLRNNVTGSTTANFATGATSSTNTKTVNLGTGGVTGSTTNVNIGSTIAGSTTVNSPALSMRAASTVSASTQIPVFISDPSTSSQIMYTRTPAQLRSDIGAGTGDGTVTSVDVSGGTTGLTTSGGPVTSSGTITLSGTLNVGSGGTGNTSFTSGKILFGNGSSAISTDTDFHWDNTNKRLGVGTATPGAKLDVLGTMMLGTQANRATITYTTNTARTFTIPNTGANADFVMTQGAQTIAGAKTFSTTPLTLSANSAVLSFSSSTGVKSITTGGTTHLALSPGGNVGVGTTAPTQKLHVEGGIRLGSTSNANNVLNTAAAGGNPSGSLYWGNKELAYSSSLYGGWTIKDSSSDTGENVSSGQDVQILGGTNVTTSRSGRNITISATDTNTATAADDILKGSNIGTEIKYSPYTTNEAANLKFYTSSNNPTGTGRLNIGAHFHSTRLYAGNGTSALPSLSFSADTNTGIFGTGSDVLGFSTAGSERMRIAANGNVGIGTTAPNDILTVIKNIEASAYTGISFQDTSTTNSKVILGRAWGETYGVTRGGTGDLFLGAANANASNGAYIILQRTVGGGHILIDGGNVGIGTTTPTGRLHSYIPNYAVTTHQYTGYFQNLATNTTTNGINKYGIYITSTGNFVGSTGTATNNYGLYVATPTGADNNYSAIFAGGNVGIGTATPIAQLDVSGTFATKMGATVSASTQIPVFVSDPSTNSQIMYTRTPAQLRSDIGAGTGTVEGTGIQDYVARWTNASTIGTGVLYDNGTNVGVGTTSPITKLHIAGDGGILAEGTYGTGWDGDTLGAGERLMWIPSKGAFRVGYVSGTQWDASNIGDFSVAMGSHNTASGLKSTAMGTATTASGPFSTAIGNNSTASGGTSTAMGYYSTASGASSIAMGYSALASGSYSTAIGRGAKAQGDTSTAMGYYSTASGDYSTAMGYYTTAQAYVSTVLGRYNVISGTTDSWVATDPIFSIGIGSNTSNRANAMTVLKNGNVGIGTTSPSTLLQLGQVGTAGTLGIAGSTSGLVTLQTAAAAGTWTMTLPTSGGSNGQVLTTNGSGVTSWANVGTASNVALSGITAAISANSINSGDYAQVWNWQLTSANKVAFTFGENVASTATGSPAILSASTLASSTAMPLYIKNLGNANSFRVDDEVSDTTPFVIDASGNVGVGTASPNSLLRIHNGSSFQTPGTYLTDWGVSYTTSNGNLAFNNSAIRGGGYPALASIAGDGSTWSTISIPSSSMGFSSFGATNAVFATLSPVGTRSSHNIVGYQPMSSQDASNHSYNLYLYSDGGSANTDIGITPTHTNIFSNINKGSGTANYNVYSIRSVVNGNTSNNATGYGVYSSVSGFGTNYSIYSAAGTNYFAGNVGIGTATPIAQLDVSGTFATKMGATVSASTQIPVFVSDPSTNSQIMYTRTPAQLRSDIGAGTGTVEGTGIQDYVARWTNASTIGTGVLYDNGTNVGVGTTSPGAKLSVNTTSYPTMELKYNNSKVVDIYSNVSSNIFIGLGSGSNITSGTGNVGYGYQALYSNTTGGGNVASGVQALYSNTTGVQNIASGYQALYFNETGTGNVAIGSQALYSSTTTSGNVAIGNAALRANTTGIQNVAIGTAALRDNTTGLRNVAIGNNALRYNTTGSFSVAIGNTALVSNTTGASNVGIGNEALGSNTTGNYNVASGFQALHSNVAKQGSTAIGHQAMRYADNIATGTTLTYNTALGYQALRGSTTAENNTGTYNTVLGANAGLGMTSGSNNTLVGYNAGNNLTTGSSNILIGSGVTASSATISNEINIGNVIYGRTDTVRVGIGVTSPTTTLDVNGQVRIRGGSPSVGKVLTSSADGTATWETPSTGGGVSWNAITNPDGDHSLSMGNHNTSWTWNTGLFSSNWTGNAASKNFFSLTTANSTTATTGALMYLGTGTSSTVNPLRIVSAGIDALFVSKPLGDGKNSRVGLGTIEPDAMLDIRVSTSEDNTEFLSMKKGSTEFFRFEKEGRLAINEDTAANGSTLKKFYRRNDQLYWDGKTLWMDGGNSIQSGLGVLGTTTNHSLQFKTNNLDRMIITNGGNVGIGTTTPGAKLSVNTSSYPTMELKYGDTKVVDIYSNNYSNIFIGLGSGSNITTGTGNVGYGYQALYSNTTGNYNVAIGQTALSSNTTGNRNVASGFQALYYNVGGSENVANGAFALFSNTTGNRNVASGYQALYSNTSGYYNVASGDQALYSNTTGNYNVAIGQTALRSNTTGNRNVASGFQALHSNVAKQGSTAIGHQAMRYADNIATGTTLTYNTALGYQALRGSTTAANNSGRVNTALGSQSLLVNTSGHHNVASGAFALVSNTSGSYNTAIGYQAGQNITTGSYNIMIGSDIMAASATGSNQLNIGNTIYGDLSTGKVGIGTANISSGAKVDIVAEFGALNDLQNVLTLERYPATGVPVSGFGAGLNFKLKHDGNDSLSVAQIFGVWEDVSYMYGSGALVFRTNGPGTQGNQERMRITANGRIQLATTNSLGYSFMQYVEGTTAQTYGISYMWFKPTAASSSWPSSRLVIDTGDDIQTQRSSGLSLGIGGTIRSQIAFNQGGKSLYLDTYMVGETSNNTQFVRMRFGSDFAERFRFRGDGTGYADVNWSTFSPYLSYNYIEKTKTKSDYPLGTVVSLSSNDRWTVTKSTESNRESVYGVIVLPEGFVSIPKELKNTVWGENKEIEELDNVISVAHLGEASTMVTTKGGNINYGDSVTTSSLSSFAQKTTEANRVLGTALESTSSWNAQTCPLVSSIASINWPADDGSNPSKPCFRLPDGTYVGKIMVFVNVSWHDPAPGELLARVEQLETQYNSINQQPNPLNSVLTVVEPSNTLTVDSHLVPNTNNTYNIGSSTKRWKNIYTQGLISIGANGNSGGVKYDTETKELQFSNDGSNWLALGSTTNEVTLSAQYPGSITTSNQIETGVGDELSGFMHYYELNNIEEESVSAEIRVRYTLPSNFASWTNDAIRLSYVTEGIDDDSSVDIEVFKQDTPNTKGHSLDNVSSVAEEWTSILLSGNQLSNTCTEPGDVCIVVIRLHSKDDSYVRVGDIKFNYNRKL